MVLSASAINTPKLLLNSGVSPKAHLAQSNNPLVAEPPVGDNLQDHVTIGFDFLVRNRSDIGWSADIFTMNATRYLMDFLAEGYGPH